MTYFKNKSILTALFTVCTLIVNAQDRPLGYWRSHLPYGYAQGLATDGKNMYPICNQAFFSIDGSSPGSTMETYSKVEGMSDIGMKCVGVDKTTGTVILVYTNGNIDLFKPKENSFYNVADLKIKSVSGDKSVNMVYAENGIAYLSTSIGILVIDLTSHNILETYQFNINNQSVPVTGFTSNGSYFYASSHGGLFRADKNNPQLQNFQVWQQVDTNTSLKYVASVNNQLFVASQRSVYVLMNDTLHKIYSCATAFGNVITHLDAGNNGVLVCEFAPDAYTGKVKTIGSDLQLADSFRAGSPVQAVQLQDGSIWEADTYYGLGKVAAGTMPGYYVPQGPSGPYSYDIYAYNKEVWVAHGGYNDNLYASPFWQGVSHLKDGLWNIYKQVKYPPFDTVDAFVALARDKTDGTMYMGSYLMGLFTLKADGSYEIMNANSILDSSSSYFGNNQRQVVSLAMDKQNNLWLTEAGAKHQLYEKNKSDGSWHRFRIPENIAGGPLAIDDFGQVWFASFSGGVVCYNPNIEVTDSNNLTNFYHFLTGVGTGNLPGNRAFAIAKDNNNSMWIGTENGIGIISNCNVESTGTTSCDAQIPTVQYDKFAGYLFAGNIVRAIAVDGANRKWVGTDDGLWLLSPNASKIIYRFTADNSPLHSNGVRKITIDPVTGDVYIGTDQGLISFHSTATDGNEAQNCMSVYPNPVPQGYSGTIGIKGLPANADVKITDMSGQLVYKTTALGSQAVWNGLDYKGHRPASGVYLVFATNADGSSTCTGKIVFVE